MTDLSETQFHPGWREALARFDAAGWQEGDLIPKDWLYEAFSIEMPLPETLFYIASKQQLAFMVQMGRFKEALLEERQVGLETAPGEGYRIVPPPEQTTWAWRHLKRDLRTIFGKATLRLVNVDHNRLTAEKLQENTDALAKLATLRGMVRRVERPSFDMPPISDGRDG